MADKQGRRSESVRETRSDLAMFVGSVVAALLLAAVIVVGSAHSKDRPTTADQTVLSASAELAEAVNGGAQIDDVWEGARTGDVVLWLWNDQLQHWELWPGSTPESPHEPQWYAVSGLDGHVCLRHINKRLAPAFDCPQMRTGPKQNSPTT